MKILTILGGVKEWTVRKVATFMFLKYLDGYKTDIMRILQGLTLIIFALSNLFPEVAAIVYVEQNWQIILVLLNQFGLEVSIQHAEIKRKYGISVHPKSLKRKKGT